MSDDVTHVVFEILAKLIEVLASREIIDRADVLELVEIAKRDEYG